MKRLKQANQTSILSGLLKTLHRRSLFTLASSAIHREPRNGGDGLGWATGINFRQRIWLDIAFTARLVFQTTLDGACALTLLTPHCSLVFPFTGAREGLRGMSNDLVEAPLRHYYWSDRAQFLYYCQSYTKYTDPQ
jgi:hypothetical protein